MAGGLLKRLTVVAVEQESVEGTAETLVDADGTMLVYDQTFTPAVERFDRNPARKYLSRLPAVQGRRAASLSFRTELKGSGSLTTKPAWDDAIRACGFSVTTVSLATVENLGGNAFFGGEYVSTTGRAKRGRVVGDFSSTLMHYVPTSGTFADADELTGESSSSTATISAAGTPASSKGWEYLPDSSSPPSATVGYYVDGTRQTMAGCRGNLRIETGAVGEPVFLAFEFSGVYVNQADATILTPPYESTIPEPFMNTDPTVLGYTSPILGNMTVDMQNTVAARQDAAKVYGIRSFIITERAPTLNTDPELELKATHDFYGNLATGTTGRSYFEIGDDNAAGERITVAMPLTQYSQISDQDREGLAVAGVDADILSASVTTGDDEVQIGMVT
jgi:hypothetical protein